MTPQVDILLQGPRGRRLCLELAMELDPDIKAMVFRLGYGLDAGRGTSRVLLNAVAAGDPETPGHAPSPEQLAARLASLRFANPDPELMQVALARSVDTARYWQEPDGEDLLAGLPIITAALSPLARQLMAAPAIQWWCQPRGAEQWAIDWRSSNGAAPLPKTPRQTPTEWSRKERAQEERAARELPLDPHANVSGAWWSIPHGLVHTVGQVPAGLSLVEDSLGWADAATVPLHGAGRTLEIGTAADWISLCRRFPLDSHRVATARLVPRDRTPGPMGDPGLGTSGGRVGRRAPHSPGLPRRRNACTRGRHRDGNGHRRVGPRQHALAHGRHARIGWPAANVAPRLARGPLDADTDLARPHATGPDQAGQVATAGRAILSRRVSTIWRAPVRTTRMGSCHLLALAGTAT